MKIKGYIRAILFLLLFLILFSCFSYTVVALDAPSEKDYKNVDAVFMYDITHNKVISEYNADEVLYTSASAKVMMGLLLSEKLADRLDEKVTITSKMLDGVKGYSSSPRLAAGEKISIEDLLYMAICASYNDAAYILSYVAYTSPSELVEEMNLRAAAVGATNTKYVNILGYPDDDAMKTTARDVYKIAKMAYENENYMMFAGAKKHTVSKTNMQDKRYIVNRNELIYSTNYSYVNKNCVGMSVGCSSDEAGWSVICGVEDEGVKYITVVLGGKEDDKSIYAYDVASNLATYVSNEYNYVRAYKSGDEVGMTSIGLTGLDTKDAAYLASSDLNLYLPSNADMENDVSYETVFISDNINAPIEAGTKIGVLRAVYNGEIVGECDLVLEKSYEKNGIMAFIQALFDYTHSRAFFASIVIFILGFIIAIIYYKRKMRVFDRHLRR